MASFMIYKMNKKKTEESDPTVKVLPFLLVDKTSGDIGVTDVI